MDPLIQYYSGQGFSPGYIKSELNPATALPHVNGPPEQDLLSRSLSYVGSAPALALSGMAQSYTNLNNSVTGDTPTSEPWVDESNLPTPASSSSGRIADFIGRGVLPAAIQLAAPEAAAGSLAEAMGAGRVMTNVLKSATGFGLLGSQDSTKTGLEQAGEGAAMGAMSAIPRLYRLPLAAALGYGSKQYFDSQNPNPIPGMGGFTQGDLQGTMSALASMSMRGPTKPLLVDHFASPIKTIDGEWLPPEQARAPLQLTPGVNQEGQVLSSQTIYDSAYPSLPAGPNTGSEGGVIHQPSTQTFDPTNPGFSAVVQPSTPLTAHIMRGTEAHEFFKPGVDAGLGYDPSELAKNNLQRLQSALDVQSQNETNSQKLSDYLASPNPEGDFNPLKGMMRQLPEYRTSEGGFIDQDLLNAIGLPLGRAIVGGGLGAVIAKTDPNHTVDPITGAIMGAAALGLGPEVAKLAIGAIQHLSTETKLNEPARLAQSTNPIIDSVQRAEELKSIQAGRSPEGEAKVSRLTKAFETPSATRAEELRANLAQAAPELSPILEEAIRQRAALPEGTDEGQLFKDQSSPSEPARGQLVADQLNSIRHTFYAGKEGVNLTALEKWIINGRWDFDHIKFDRPLTGPLIDLTGDQFHVNSQAVSSYDPIHIVNKLEEARLTDGIPETHSLLELGHDTINDSTVQTLDKKFGENQWIVKDFAKGAMQSSNVFRAEEVKAALTDNPEAFSPYDTSSLMAQARYNIPEGSKEYRVHAISDPATGKVSIIPFATFEKGSALALADRVPLLYRTPDVVDAEKAVRNALNSLPEGDRSGTMFGPDVVKTDKGWQVVELNPTISSEGASGYAIDNPLAQDAIISKMAGKPSIAQTIANALIRPDSEDLQSLQTESKGMRKRNLNIAGSAMPEVSAAITRMFVGGTLGGVIGGVTDDPNDHSHFMVGAMIGAAAGLVGPSAARWALAAIAGHKILPPLSPKNGWADFVRNFDSKVETRMGAELNGSKLFTDRFARFLDRSLNLTVPDAIENALKDAKGFGSVLLDRIDRSLRSMAIRFEPEQQVKDITNQYLDGKMDATAYQQAMQPFIAKDIQNKAFAGFAVTGRESIDAFQRIVQNGIKDPKLQKIIKDSIGSYLTKSYKLFTDPRWEPDQAATDSLVHEMIAKKVWPNANEENIRQALRQYVREVKSAKGAYSVTGSSGGLGEKINQNVLKERKDMSDAWKTFLGDITDPRDRIYQTAFRLRPIAEASQYFENLAGVVDDSGMKHVFNSYADFNAYRSNLLQSLQNLSKDDPQVGAINKKLQSLTSFQNVPEKAQFGNLQGKLVSRHVWDSLATFDAMTDVTQHPWLRSIANFNTFIKLGATALNPLRVIRNAWTIPSFMAIAKVMPQDIANAWKITRDSNHPLRNELLLHGILNVDQVKSEFFREFENLTQNKMNLGTIDMSNFGLGRIDLDLAEKYGRRGLRNVLDLYRIPDNLIRVGAYLSAKARIADNLGLAASDPKVIEQATNYVNRYTMNYDAIAPGFKVARQIPLVNLFISYAAEMGRIGKNLAEDVVKGNFTNGIEDHSRNGRLYAMAPLAAMSIIPPMVQNASEQALSPQDRSDWEKTKQLMSPESRNRFRFVLSRDAKTKQFTYLDFTPWLAADSYNQMGQAIKNQDWKGLAAVNPVIGWENTPLFNIAMSQASGTDVNTGHDFRPARTAEGVEDRFASIARTILPPWTPGVGSEAVRLQQAYTPNAQGELGITNLKSGNRLTPSDFWESYMTGIKKGGANLAILSDRVDNDFKNEVSNEISYLNDIMKSDANPDLKARAMDRTKQALSTLVGYYQARLGVGAPPAK